MKLNKKKRKCTNWNCKWKICRIKKVDLTKKLPLLQKSFNTCMSRLSSGNSKRRMSQNYNWNTPFFLGHWQVMWQTRTSHVTFFKTWRSACVSGRRRSFLWNRRLWPPRNPSHMAFPAKLPSTRLCCLLLAIMTACALVANGSYLCQNLERPLPRFLEWGEDTLFLLLLLLHNITEWKRRHFTSVFYQHFKNISYISGLETRLVIRHSLNRKVNDADRGRGFLMSYLMDARMSRPVQLEHSQTLHMSTLALLLWLFWYFSGSLLEDNSPDSLNLEFWDNPNRGCRVPDLVLLLYNLCK